ncbi:MAG: glycosyltransferase family 2 protein [Desulfobacteraceae bacterium]|nr:glycosyltransferase family 2 protein [Desulfobacteraceae bacterium]MBC2749210.1 glycosyltransferase family 2 protein [Desulfobacteraceae bacterium]
MDAILAIIFWNSVIILTYTYVGYPILLTALSYVLHRPVKKDENSIPKVTLIISVYNEERVIRERLENALSQNYPFEKYEIIVASDGSTDETHNIINGFKDPRIQLIIQEERLGKTAALNATVPKSSGDIIVFTDANSMYDKDAIRAMMQNFADSDVGCVTGETRLLNPEGSAIGQNEMAYYSYDTLFKIRESNIGSTVGADGAIFAIRKELYQPLDPSLINDFVIPLQVVSQGYRVIYEPKAFLYEATATPLKGGFSRRVRIINRALFGAFTVPSVFNPRKVGFFALQIISRKLLRWIAPVFLILAFLSNAGLLSVMLYRLTMIAQILFYAVALAYPFFGNRVSHKLFNFPYYFCHGNTAALVALFKFIRGQRIVVWEPLRR